MDDKDIPNKTACTFSFYLDESDILHCAMTAKNGDQIELAKHIFVESSTIPKTAFFSVCEDVDAAAKSLSEMVGMDFTDIDKYSKKLWEVKKDLEERAIEASVTERTVYNLMDDRRFKAVHKQIGGLRNQVDDLVIKYSDQTALREIKNMFEGFKNRLDRNRDEFLPEMKTWVEYVE